MHGCERYGLTVNVWKLFVPGPPNTSLLTQQGGTLLLQDEQTIFRQNDAGTNPRFGNVMRLCFPQTDTMRSFFAQKDYMQVFKFILDCLDFLKIWSGFLTNVIRLVGWPKHCSLPLELQDLK